MSGARGLSVLYLSYDGMTDPLGRSQVLPYLTGLAALGHRFTLVSFEKRDRLDKAGETIARLCAGAGIEWVPLTYHKQPPILSTVWDVAAMTRRAAALHRRTGFDLVHCRSYLPALAGLRLKRRFGIPFLFDTRAFWADEKVEGRFWRLEHPVYRRVYDFFKRRETEFLAEADGVIVLTHAAARELGTRDDAPTVAAKLSVIPCCVDFDHFTLGEPAEKEAARAELGIGAARYVLLYLGSLGGNYMLDEMLDFFAALKRRRPEAMFLFVTQDAPQAILAAAEARGVDPTDLVVRRAEREEVPGFVAAADLGVAFKQPSFSARACSPTKLGEMLAVGLPVVANAGVGDVEEMLTATSAGIVVDAFDTESLGAAADRALRLEPSRGDVRDAARQWFLLGDGVARYDAAYRAVAGQDVGPLVRAADRPEPKP